MPSSKNSFFKKNMWNGSKHRSFKLFKDVLHLLYEIVHSNRQKLYGIIKYFLSQISECLTRRIPIIKDA